MILLALLIFKTIITKLMVLHLGGGGGDPYRKSQKEVCMCIEAWSCYRTRGLNTVASVSRVQCAAQGFFAFFICTQNSCVTLLPSPVIKGPLTPHFLPLPHVLPISLSSSCQAFVFSSTPGNHCVYFCSLHNACSPPPRIPKSLYLDVPILWTNQRVPPSSNCPNESNCACLLVPSYAFWFPWPPFPPSSQYLLFSPHQGFCIPILPPGSLCVPHPPLFLSFLILHFLSFPSLSYDMQSCTGRAGMRGTERLEWVNGDHQPTMTEAVHPGSTTTVHLFYPISCA